MQNILVDNNMNKLRDILQKRGITPYQLAKMAGIGEKTAYRYGSEVDDLNIDRIAYGTVWRIAKALDIKTEDLRSDDKVGD